MFRKAQARLNRILGTSWKYIVKLVLGSLISEIESEFPFIDYSMPKRVKNKSKLCLNFNSRCQKLWNLFTLSKSSSRPGSDLALQTVWYSWQHHIWDEIREYLPYHRPNWEKYIFHTELTIKFLAYLTEESAGIEVDLLRP